MKKILLATLYLVTTASFAQTVNQFEPSFYGFVKASSSYSNNALSSYNNINLSAPTNSTPHTRAQDSKSRMSFQAQQSRLGVALKKGANLEGKFEFDLIDFNKSSPTTQMVPRVRIASATYHLDEDTKIIVGQDWDLFSPTTAYTYDIVGLYFLAGNSGFMRQQAQILHTKGHFEYGAAIGMAGNNPGVTDSDLEMGQGPTYSARATYIIDKQSRLGLSGIYSDIKYVTGDSSKHSAYGANAFFEQVWEHFQVKSEFYYGQNLANIGSLTIGKGTSSASLRDYGGFATFLVKLAEKHNVSTGYGFAKVDNGQKVAPYSLTTAGIVNTPGIMQNNIGRLNYEYKVSSDFSWIIEYTHFNTTAKLAGNFEKTTNSNMIESGILLKF